MSENTKYIHRYTTASVINDVRGTVTVNKRAGVTATGHDVRLVAIPEELLAQQLKFYVTGLFMVMDEQEWKVEQQFGNVTALDDQSTA
jgi:hypothetical protein